MAKEAIRPPTDGVDGPLTASKCQAVALQLARPALWISHMIGKTFPANLILSSCRALPMRLTAPAGSRGPPNRFPRALAAARAALVRSESASRSCSATAARIWMVSLLAWDVNRVRRRE